MEAVSASAGPSSSSSTNTRNPWPLKQLLKAGYELLQPPSPLSRDPVSLRRQLERSDATLPDELYKNSQDKWCDCGGTPGGGHARDTTEDLRCLIVSRTQYLLVEMQRILEKEYRQVDLRGGLLPDDCEYRVFLTWSGVSSGLINPSPAWDRRPSVDQDDDQLNYGSLSRALEPTYTSYRRDRLHAAARSG